MLVGLLVSVIVVAVFMVWVDVQANVVVAIVFVVFVRLIFKDGIIGV